MTNVHEAALAWLEKQLRKKKIARFRAESKPIVSEKEIADIDGSVDVLKHLIALVEDAERDKADTVYIDRDAFLRDAERAKADIEASGQTFTAADLMYMISCADGASVVQAWDNEWMDPETELPTDPDKVVLVICSGTAGNVRLEDAYELAWYDPVEGEWILEAYPGEADIRVSWWRDLPEMPEG